MHCGLDMSEGGAVNQFEYIGGRMLEEFCGCSDGVCAHKNVQGGKTWRREMICCGNLIKNVQKEKKEMRPIQSR